MLELFTEHMIFLVNSCNHTEYSPVISLPHQEFPRSQKNSHANCPTTNNREIENATKNKYWEVAFILHL